MNKHLDNVCIMQKYNDSEKVLELREQFSESESYIKKAVNNHDCLIECLEDCLAYIEQVNESKGEYSIDQESTDIAIESIKRTLKKASE